MYWIIHKQVVVFSRKIWYIGKHTELFVKFSLVTRNINLNHKLIGASKLHLVTVVDPNNIEV